MRAGKTAIATAFGQDVADIDEYQPGRYSPPIFCVGDDFYCCTKSSSPPKTKCRDDISDWTWIPAKGIDWFTRQYELTVWKHEPKE